MILFVYGTLKRGFSNHDVFLKESKFLCDDKIDGFALYDLGMFPAASPSTGNSIYVEAYDIPDKKISFIDRLEGVPIFYKRKQVTSNKGLTGYIYFQNISKNNFKKISSGNWIGGRRNEKDNQNNK